MGSQDERPAGTVGRRDDAARWDRRLPGVDDSGRPVREQIARSWSRSRELGLRPDAALNAVARSEVDPGSVLMAAAAPVLEQLAEQLAGSHHSLVLADRHCRVVHRWFDDPVAENVFDDLGFLPGAHLLEESIGTNALGTAMELRRRVVVNGSEHFADKLKRFSCYGHPIRHPVTDRIEGVLDSTAVAPNANPLLAALVARAVHDIQNRLLDGTASAQHHLLTAFQAAARRPFAVVALDDDLVLSNRAATEQLDPADLATLRTLISHRRSDQAFTVLLDLADGRPVAVRAVPVAGGAVFEVQYAEAGRLPGRGIAATPTLRHARGQLPVLISGEPGTGRTTAALAVCVRAPVMVLEPGLAVLEGESVFARQFAEAMDTGAGTVLVDGADLLPERLLHLVMDRARDARRPDLVITTGPVEQLTGLARTLSSMCVRSRDLARLGCRAGELGDLATAMLAEVGAADLRLTPVVIRALAEHSWPGNFHELRAVLSAVAARRSAGDVILTDLPPAYRHVGTGRVLAGLERAERDAIVAALAATDGNKLRAARALGVSRSTLYNRLRTLKIPA